MRQKCAKGALEGFLGRRQALEDDVNHCGVVHTLIDVSKLAKKCVNIKEELFNRETFKHVNVVELILEIKLALNSDKLKMFLQTIPNDGRIGAHATNSGNKC